MLHYGSTVHDMTHLPQYLEGVDGMESVPEEHKEQAKKIMAASMKAIKIRKRLKKLGLCLLT